MSDLISRQAAIDICNFAIDFWRGQLGEGIVIAVRKRIEQLPAVQPQPVRCKDCKWCEDADGLMCKNPASWVVATDRDFGCVLAERRGRRRASDE